MKRRNMAKLFWDKNYRESLQLLELYLSTPVEVERTKESLPGGRKTRLLNSSLLSLMRRNFAKKYPLLDSMFFLLSECIF